jgi:hypothetical protein
MLLLKTWMTDFVDGLLGLVFMEGAKSVVVLVKHLSVVVALPPWNVKQVANAGAAESCSDTITLPASAAAKKPRRCHVRLPDMRLPLFRLTEITPAPNLAAPFRAPLRRFPNLAHPSLPLVPASCACLVRFTGGFWAAAIVAQPEPSENQWVVVLEQHYYTREL